MNQKISLLTLFLILFTGASFAVTGSIKETVFDKEKGYFTCEGGASAPLFKQDCKELTISRVSFGGNIVYEASCLDSNGTKFVLACLSFAFEPDRVVSSSKKNYFEQ